MNLAKFHMRRVCFTMKPAFNNALYTRSMFPVYGRRYIKNPIDMEKRKQEKENQAFRDDINYFLGKSGTQIIDNL